MSSEATSAEGARAGRFGDDVRADCLVVARPGSGETIVRSRSGAVEDDAIRRRIDTMRRTFGADGVDVEIDDAGAPAFVLSARIEAAFRGLGLHPRDDARSEPNVALPPPSPRDRRRRSRLYLPGDAPKFMVDAALHAPDAVILDLEDGVHPDHKTAARVLVRNALGAVDFGAAERMVRINRGNRGVTDVVAVVPEGVDVILIPKVETADTVHEIEETVAAVQTKAGLDRPVWLVPILESALGIENAFAIASASERVAALTIGLEDYTADLGVSKTPTGEESLYARQRLVNAARAAGVQALDSVYGDFGDLAGLDAWCTRSRAIGFAGMGCVHPRQIEIIRRGFAPSAVELDRARRIVEAFREAEAAGRSVVSLGNKMIDPPVVKRALKLVAEADGA